jgi:hypothetical protein
LSTDRDPIASSFDPSAVPESNYCVSENIEVLRDCLARADFKERLSIPCGQLIEDRSPAGDISSRNVKNDKFLFEMVAPRRGEVVIVQAVIGL